MKVNHNIHICNWLKFRIKFACCHFLGDGKQLDFLILENVSGVAKRSFKGSLFTSKNIYLQNRHDRYWKTAYLKFLVKMIYVEYIPESFNIDISYQLFDYKITYVNSQRKNTISKGDFVLQTGLKIFGIQN